MNVFISWSGDRSRLVAELLSDWIKCVLQSCKPWISTKDIDRGAVWFSEIGDALTETKVGIVCLTTSNLNAPWILFESGALAKGISSQRICTFLIDLQPNDVKPPLSSFNHTLPTREGLWELILTLNRSLESEKLTNEVLDRVFSTFYPQFEEEFKVIIENTKKEFTPIKRDENDLLNEILEISRSFEQRLMQVEKRSSIASLNNSKSNKEYRYLEDLEPDSYSRESVEFVTGVVPKNVSASQLKSQQYEMLKVAAGKLSKKNNSNNDVT